MLVPVRFRQAVQREAGTPSLSTDVQITGEMRTIVIVSGYFNPVHKGHIEYFHNARALGDQLFVIVNNDYQRELKGSKDFQDQEERLFIVSELGVVNGGMISIDQDRTVCESIRYAHSIYHDEHTKLIFANGGDQNNNDIPEREVCEELGIELIDGLGDKIQSSSWLLSK
jgi:cytidyltransferase-like protein